MVSSIPDCTNIMLDLT